MILSVAAKNTDPLLEGIFLEAKEDTLTMCTYDLEKGIRSRIPVEIEEEGSIIVDAQKLIAIIHSLPDGDVTMKNDNSFLLNITAGDADFQILGTDGRNYPNLPNVKGDINFTLPQKKLRKVISETLFAVSNDDTRPVYTGSLFEIDGSKMTVVALNGNRLAVGIQNGMTEDESLKLRFIIPGKAQNSILRILNDSEEPVSVEMARKHIIFTFDNIYFISRLLDGDFMDYAKKIPPVFQTVAVVNKARLIEGIERAALIIDEKNKNSVKLIFKDNTLFVNCITEMGKVNDFFEIGLSGEALEIGFNHKYILEALRASEDDTLKMQLTGSIGPCVIVPDKRKNEDSDYLHLVLPVKLKD